MPDRRAVLARQELRVDVSEAAPPGCRTLAVEVIAPAQPPETPAVLFCFPGGAMNRRYFDVAVPGYSFAEYACSRGFVTVLIDHPGVGDSDVPDDGWSLTPSVIARTNAAAVRAVMALLGADGLAGLAPLRPAMVLGVGHSMGAHLLLHHQAAHPQFDALVLLGWGGGAGLPDHLSADERTVSALPGPLEPRIVEIARRHNPEPLVIARGSGTVRMVANPLPPAVRQAMDEVRSPLLAVAGWSSMIPGSVREAVAKVTVPVFVGIGEHDIAVGHHEIPAQLPASHDITLFVLPGAGHNHNIEPNRERLWARLTWWVRGLAASANV
jgi:pimeloyl-ACP methyl ester carboxylesterase